MLIWMCSGAITSRLLDIGLAGMAMFTSYKFIQAL